MDSDLIFPSKLMSSPAVVDALKIPFPKRLSDFGSDDEAFPDVRDEDTPEVSSQASLTATDKSDINCCPTAAAGHTCTPSPLYRLFSELTTHCHRSTEPSHCPWPTNGQPCLACLSINCQAIRITGPPGIPGLIEQLSNHLQPYNGNCTGRTTLQGCVGFSTTGNLGHVTTITHGAWACWADNWETDSSCSTGWLNELHASRHE
jgi:hypothetical protein